MNAIWIAVAAVSLLGLAFGAILGYAPAVLRWKTIRSLRKLTKSYRRASVVSAVIPAVAPTRKPSAVTVKKLTAAPQVAKL